MRITKKKNKYLSLFINLSLVLLGVIIGVAVGSYGNIPVAQEVNLMDMATLVVTVFLAVYVPTVLDWRLQNLRDRKDLLESRIEDYQTLLRRMNILVQENKELPVDEHLTLRNLLDIASHRVDTLIALIKNSGLDPALNKDIAAIKKLDNEHMALLSDRSVYDPDTGFSEDIRMKQELLYNKLDEATSLLVFNISNSK